VKRFLATVAFCIAASAAQAQDDRFTDAFRYLVSSSPVQSTFQPWAQPRKMDTPPVGVFVPWPSARVVPAPSVKPPTEAPQEIVQHPVYRPQTPKQPTAVIKWSVPILPPVEYDRPYDGELILNRLDTEQDVADFCKLKGPRLGCAYRIGYTRCVVTIASDASIRARGFTRDVVMRHELAHCLGWPGDHPGARSSESVRTN
jgi:hypothetical protein